MSRRNFRTGAIIVAAGSSQRMGGVDKLLRPLDGRPLIAYSIAAFAASNDIDWLVIVTSLSNRTAITEIATQLAPEARVVLGGERRQDSVRAGIDALDDVDYIVVHDGARPLVNEVMIEDALQGAIEVGAAICATPVTDTIKRASGDDLIAGTVDRRSLRQAQTPQAFRRDLLLRAHEQDHADATDDAALIERLGLPVKLVPGSPRNIKVTTPDDLHVAEALLQRAGARDSE
jgi:2-C-methyl-D-erythritol 4-phosphate cytidylyltransferase